MRHPIVLTCLFALIVAVGVSGISALPWASNQGCQDLLGTRDADVSLQVIPFGIVCSYEADATRPAEVVVRTASISGFSAWLVCIAVVVAIGIRRRTNPAARGVVAGVAVLGAFGLAATVFEMSAALMMTVIFGPLAVGVIDAWLSPGRAAAVVSTAIMVPFAVVAAWFVPGLYGWEELAVVVALAAGAAATILGSRVTDLFPVAFEPLR